MNSIIFRSAALFAILYQVRLIAGGLADTAVFVATMLAAFGAAVFLARFSINGKKIKTLPAIISLALIPWAARAFIAMPRFFVPADAVTLDALLLNFDLNNFVALLPFYWAAASTWFSIRSRLFLRAAVIVDALLLILIFTIAHISDLAIYRWPIVMIILLAGIVFLQALSLLFSMPPSIKLNKREKIIATAALLILVFTGGFLFLKPSQQRAAQKGGGLLEPKLFSFDFSQFLRLDSEISMNDDLVLIVKKGPSGHNILLRRSVMSGYSKKQGFFRIEEIDERTHPQRLPARQTQFSQPEFKLARTVKQEYFLVNFDAAAFIGMKEPAEITPYENWDSSSFKSAYLVESLASDAEYADYSQSVYNENGGIFWPGPQDLGLSEKEFAQYTAYGDDGQIRALAEDLTRGFDRYSDKVEVIYEWLKYGEFRYSLRPGIAPDGDQLAWFLFNSKKGYCSYYAFAMALLLRSIGIPSRVAAGFFIDPSDGVFDYYPVRSDMAHAWVEVPFPGYGWIEFDPTSENFAEDEEFRFSSGVDPQLFERLMREILENRSRLRAKTGNEIRDALRDRHSLTRLSAMLIKNLLLPLLLLALVIIFAIIRCGYMFLFVMRNSKRKKAVYLWKHARQRLRLAGLFSSKLHQFSEPEKAAENDKLVKGTYSLYLGAAAARFAPEFNGSDFDSIKNSYRVFNASYKKTIPLWRRLLAWILPPLALALNKPGKKLLTVLVLLVFLASSDGRAQFPDGASFVSANELYTGAVEAERAEYWERAINLYKEGRANFPQDLRFPLGLGNLYYSKYLFGLAWDEYQAAVSLSPHDSYILLKLAYTAGYLNLDRTSAAYLERLLSIDPGNRDAISYLGWVYYKVHRLDDGEALLASALERFGDDADLAMTLGTVYSAMFRYDEGKYWYQKAIALSAGIRGFTTVAHYNLSILESRFYHYELAMNEANASLDQMNRSSGFLARGEIQLRRLDLEKAQADFETAREIEQVDRSPLSKINLAHAYQISGRLEEARLYARDCLKNTDQSWMANYGTDPVRFKRDIHEILYKTYYGLGKAERFLPWGTLDGRIRSAFRAASYRFYYSVHRRLFQKYSLASGDAYRHDNLSLEQYLQYYNAFYTYPGRALVYLQKARDFETSIIPASEGSYYLEEGKLRKQARLTAAALGLLDPVWERDLISECYSEFALRGLQSPAEELFSMNRGALLQAGISLPVEIRFQSSGGIGRGKERAIMKALSKAGFAQAHGQARFRLDITVNAAQMGLAVLCELIDTEGAQEPLRRTIPLRSLARADISSFARTLSGSIFRVDR
jgi:Tfp pilus assembly protein PilF